MSVFSQFQNSQTGRPALEIHVEEERRDDRRDRREDERRDLRGRVDRDQFQEPLVQLAFDRVPNEGEIQILARMRQQYLSDRNPVDDQVLLKVIDFNKGGNREQLVEIYHNVNALQNNQHKAEVVQLLQNLRARHELSLALGLLKEGDVTSFFSQGIVHELDRELREGEGQFACSSICAEAILHLSQGNTITTDQELEAVIIAGVKKRNAYGLRNEPVPFPQVMGKVNEQGAVLDFVVVDNVDQYDTERKENPVIYPYQGVFPQGKQSSLDKVLHGLRGAGRNKYAVLTTNNESLLVYFNDKGKPVLFDSHGKPYMGMDKGASIRQFESIGDLVNHLNNAYDQCIFTAYLTEVTG